MTLFIQLVMKNHFFIYFLWIDHYITVILFFYFILKPVDVQHLAVFILLIVLYDTITIQHTIQYAMSCDTIQYLASLLGTIVGFIFNSV